MSPSAYPEFAEDPNVKRPRARHLSAFPYDNIASDTKSFRGVAQQ